MLDDLTTGERRHKSLEFGGFTLDSERGSLSRDGAEIRLRPQSYEVLRYLAQNHNRLVTKDEIFASVWGRTVVTDDSLAQCLMDIRRALDDGTHEIIRTVPRRGYVFDIPVREVPGVDEAPAGALAQDASASGKPGARRGWLAAVAVAAIAVAGLAWWGTTRTTDSPPVGTTTGAGAASGRSIAVLPFIDLSDTQDQQYFAEGLSEEILNLLAQSPELRVIARTSSFSFRARPEADVREIGRQLRVSHVLEGSVRKAGARARITAQLISTHDGSHLWSDTFDRDLADVLQVQGEIAGQITRALRIRLAPAAIPAARPQAVDPRAYEHYLHARFLHSRRAPGDLAAAEDHYQRALAIDENFGRAWAGLAGTLVVSLFEPYDERDPGVVMERMRIAVERSLALEPGSAEVQRRAANYYFQVGEFDRAREHSRKARAIDPDHPLVLGAQVGGAVLRGDYEQAVRLWERALLRDPLGFITRRNYANDLANAGRFEDAYRELQRARELNPVQESNDFDEAGLLYLLGRHEEALRLLESAPDGARREGHLAIVLRALGRDQEADAQEALLMRREEPERSERMAEVYAQRGELDQALASIERARAIQVETAPTPGMRKYPDAGLGVPLLRPLYDDPRWQRFLHQTGS